LLINGEKVTFNIYDIIEIKRGVVNMSVEELIKKVQESSKRRTLDEKKEILVKAKILNNDGYYDERFFTPETVAKSKLIAKAS